MKSFFSLSRKNKKHRTKCKSKCKSKTRRRSRVMKGG